MKKLLYILLACLVAMPMLAQKKAQKRAAIFTNPANYSCQIIGVGTTGTKYFEVSGNGKGTEAAIWQAQMNAIHAVLFKDIPGTSTADPSPAIYGAAAPKPEHEAFFDEFFAPNGLYFTFIANQSEKPKGKDVINMGKGYYQVKLSVQVNYDALRKHLIDNKIIQGLGESLGNTLKPTMMIFPAKEWCRAMGYVDGSNNPDYEKALQNSDLRDMITLFEGFMAENGYPIHNLRQSLDNFAENQAFKMANDMVEGNEKAESAFDILLSAFKPDLIIQFEPRKKSYAGQQYYEFALNVYDVFGQNQCSNLAQGTPVSGSAQQVNQLKEAIQNVRDKFFNQINATFARQMEAGRQIEIVLDRRDMCEVRYDDMVNGYRLSETVTDWVQNYAMEGKEFSKQITPNVITLKAVYIPYTIEKVNRFGKKVVQGQHAVDFGQRLADFLAQETGQNFSVLDRGSKVVITMGDDATRDF